MQDTSTLQSGTYAYTHTPRIGRGYRVTVHVQAGQVTAYATGEGDTAQHATPAQLQGMAPHILRTVAHEIEVRGRVPGLMVPVTFTPATIGKARAAHLHRLMGRLGLCNPDHYGSARRATGRDVFSLATLTEQEAREVWAYLCRTFPQARTLAA